MNTNNPLPFTIGLTGGIGSGKSTVSQIFADIPVPVIDTDLLSRELVVKASPLLAKIADYFGPQVLLENGELNRQHLRSLIFSEPDKKKWLEQLLHPQIKRLVLNQLSRHTKGYVIVVVPLLFENITTSDSYNFINTTLVVDCSEALQLERSIARDQTNSIEIESIIKSQMPRAERIALADDVIVNDGNLNSLKEKVLEIHEKYQQLSH